MRLHTLLSLFASSLDHLTSYAISSRTARPNHCSLGQFENENYATCYYAESFEVCLFPFYIRCLVYLRLAWTI